MTVQEKELLDLIRNYHDREYAVITAINILTALSEPHESSQLPASSCHRGRNGKGQ